MTSTEGIQHLFSSSSPLKLSLKEDHSPKNSSLVFQEHGSGAADASQSEGHQSKLTARMASQTQTQKKTQVQLDLTKSDESSRLTPFVCESMVLLCFTILFQSFKRKPGQADNERSTGDYNERINKRLRTVESRKDCTEDSRQSDGQQESDLYEHIKQGETAYDTQTYGQ